MLLKLLMESLKGRHLEGLDVDGRILKQGVYWIHLAQDNWLWDLVKR
jgi:hypothetical protein